MPIVADPNFPAEAAQELAALTPALDDAIPTKQLDRNLLVASWNIRELGRTNGKWTTEQGDTPKRNLADIHHIAEILSRFDVIAVQEVQNNLQALRDVMRCLGPSWGFHVTDVNFGDAGDDERLAYLYDLRRVQPSGLVGELVLTEEDLGTPPRKGGDPAEPLVNELDRQLVKTPYMMSFTSAGRPFVLATVHVIFGDDTETRAREAEALAKMLQRAVKTRAGERDDFRMNMIALGDFNITSEDDEIFKALVEHGLQPDAGTLDSPRTLSDAKGRDEIAYDQIAWFKKPLDGALQFSRLSGGTFPWNKHILLGAKGDPSFRISDHFPLWLEFSMRDEPEDG